MAVVRTLGIFLLALLPELTSAAAPVLFHTAGYESPVTADPDDLLMIAGSGFQTTDRVVYEAVPAARSGEHPEIPTGSADATRGIARTVAVSPATNAITVRLPASLRAHEIYRLWVVTARGEWSQPITVNDPRPLWITPGVVYSTADRAGLRRRVRVVGRNLDPGSAQPFLIRLAGPQTHILTRVAPDEVAMQHYVAEAELPRRVIPGAYRVSVSRDGRIWTDMAGSLEVVADPPTLAEFSPADAQFGACRPDDDSDDTACLERAIEAARLAGGGTVSLPAGRWIVSPRALSADRRRDGLLLGANVSLRGAGADKTILIRRDAHTAPAPGALLTLTGKNSVVGITFSEDERYTSVQQSRTVIQLGIPWDDLGPVGKSTPEVVDDVTIYNNFFRRVGCAVVDSGRPMRHLFITDNQFAAYDNALLLTGSRFNVGQQYRIDDSVIRGNRFVPGSYLDLAQGQGTIASQLGASQRVDFSENTADGTSIEGLQDPGDPPGWRAGFFWNTNSNHELVLVADNAISCSGDKAGDGEAIAFDGNGNTFGFDAAPHVRAAGPDWISVAGPLLKSQNGRTVPDDYYNGHWVSVVEGVGLGQTRRITSYLQSQDGSSVTFHVAPRWDVVPAGGSGRILVGRQFWQVYLVANRVEHGRPPCKKGNLSGPHGGIVGFWGPVADSVIDGNRQTDSDGIGFGQNYSAHTPSCPKCAGSASFVTALEIKHNSVSGEYDWSSDCSRSGIGGVFGASPTPESPPPVLSFGVVIAHNIVTHADGLHGGAISISQSWYAGPPPGDWPLVENLLVFQNEINEITGSPPSTACRYNQRGRVGIRLDGKQNVRDTVLDANRCTHVDRFLEDAGRDTRRDCSAAIATTCECQHP